MIIPAALYLYRPVSFHLTPLVEADTPLEVDHKVEGSWTSQDRRLAADNTHAHC